MLSIEHQITISIVIYRKDNLRTGTPIALVCPQLKVRNIQSKILPIVYKELAKGSLLWACKSNYLEGQNRRNPYHRQPKILHGWRVSLLERSQVDLLVPHEHHLVLPLQQQPLCLWLRQMHLQIPWSPSSCVTKAYNNVKILQRRKIFTAMSLNQCYVSVKESEYK